MELTVFFIKAAFPLLANGANARSSSKKLLPSVLSRSVPDIFSLTREAETPSQSVRRLMQIKELDISRADNPVY